MKSSKLFPVILATAMFNGGKLKAGADCPGFELMPAALLFSRDTVNPYQFEVFASFIALGHCDSSCPTTNVTLNVGQVVGCVVTPPVLYPDGGLVVIDCTVVEDPEMDCGLMIIDLPCARTVTNVVVFPLLPPPAVLADPADVDAVTGEEACFSVEALYAFEYQWQKDGLDLKETGHTRGVTSSLLHISHVGVPDAGSYSVTVRNPAGTERSASATLIVHRGLRNFGDSVRSTP